MKLLSRPEFSQQVLARNRGRCVLCSKPAVDAHHILERKLWPDGGYYLPNGAGVCDDCHMGCETTSISVEEVRLAAGINFVLLPPCLAAGHIYDKWGNLVRADGLREPGPLFEDTGCQKALIRGGYRGLFVPKGTLLL